MASSGLKYLYVPATDVGARREFYSGAVGLQEMYSSEEEGALAYDCAGLQFTVYFSADADLSKPHAGRSSLVGQWVAMLP